MVRTYIVNTDISLEVCNLVPATNYMVDIKIKPLGGTYYSNTADTDFETCHTAPSLAPHMEASGYSRGYCAYGYRPVVVYWEKINQKYHNGPLLEYNVFMDDAEAGTRGPQEVSSSLSIPCEGQHSVSVRGCNQQGCSPKASILIPSYREKVDLQKVVMEQSSGDVHLTWFGTENEAITAVDIAWCKMRPAGFKCKDGIHILRSENANSIVLHQETIGQDIDDYLFGVAAINNRNISSGVTWQDECRYIKNAVPPAVQHVSLLPSFPNNSLTISWAPINCESGTNNAYINQYQIIYCQQPKENTCDKVFMVRISAWGITQYTLRDLMPDVEYGVMVRALSLTKEGPQSKMITGRPNNNGGFTVDLFCTELSLEANDTWNDISAGGDAGGEAGSEAGGEAGEAGGEAADEAGGEAADEAGGEAGGGNGGEAGGGFTVDLFCTELSIEANDTWNDISAEGDDGGEAGSEAGGEAGEAGGEAADEAGGEAGGKAGGMSSGEAGRQAGGEAADEAGSEAADEAGGEAGGENGGEAGGKAGDEAGGKAGGEAADEAGG
uniref:Fibronectin type-III domain-containing protein n=1 Tax=Magallana gigas TaxID=29159 RepID=A0A8W8LWR6_MAGGI